MSSGELFQPLTARVFLLGKSEGASSAEVFASSLSERGIAGSAIEGLRHLSASALKAVDHEVAAVADGFLNLDLGSVLVSGWRKYTDLTGAAARTLAAPGSEEVVILAAHRVISTHHPSVDLLVDGVKVYTFVFDLNVVFDLNGVVAVVRLGELVALRGGECVVTVSLALEGLPLMPQRQGRVDLALVVRLRPAIPLLREAVRRRQPPTSAGRSTEPNPAGPAGSQRDSPRRGRAPDPDGRAGPPPTP